MIIGTQNVFFQGHLERSGSCSFENDCFCSSGWSSVHSKYTFFANTFFLLFEVTVNKYGDYYVCFRGLFHNGKIIIYLKDIILLFLPFCNTLEVTMRKNILYFVVIFLVIDNHHFLSSYLNEGCKKGYSISIFGSSSFSSELEVTLCKYILQNVIQAKKYMFYIYVQI